MSADMTADDKDWLTIPEAAAYLDKSEPTIYRWMKEGVLSYYKVGRATRFTKESLDALIEKSTSTQEAESSSRRCVCCGHAHLVDGQVQSTGRVYFRPDQAKFWTLTDAMIGVRAKVCMACGFMQIHADVNKLKKLVADVPKARRTDDHSSKEQ